MDEVSIPNRDLLVPLGDIPREHPGAARLSAAGHLPSVRTWSHSTFRSHNVMLLLSGSGHFRLQGREWLLRAPCLFRQPGGKPGDYGPEIRWEELFFCYDSPAQRDLARRGVWDDAHPVLLLPHDPTWLTLAHQCITLLRRNPPPADVIDRLAEALLVQAILLGKTGTGTTPSGTHDYELAWERRIVADPGNAWDFAHIAADLGISLQHFRRRWRARRGCSPDRWLLQMRLQHARHLLQDPHLRVADVAQACGFADPYYFSRAFRRHYGLNPRAARARTPLPGD